MAGGKVGVLDRDDPGVAAEVPVSRFSVCSSPWIADATSSSNVSSSSTAVHACTQGRIEPPKAARGHATYIDGKMLSVTKYRIQIWTV